MSETVLSIFAIIFIMVVIPVVILRIRDRSKLIGGLINRALGLCALFISIAVIILLNYDALTGNHGLTFDALLRLALTALGVTFIYGAMARTGWEWFTDSGSGIETHEIDVKSPEYQEALINAKRNLPYFIEQVDKQVGQAYVMIPLEWEEGIVQDEWAHVNKHEQGVFTVSPQDWWLSPNEQYEERFDISANEVVDWKIVHDDGRIKGAYSTIGAFHNFERKGRRLNRTMKKQKSMLVDAR